MVGIYWFLANCPIWATAMILYFSTLGVIHVGRDYFEGIPYQVAYSAQFGDTLLFGAVLIAATILQQRDGADIPLWFQGLGTQILVLGGCFLLGFVVCIVTLKTRSGQKMDMFHDIAMGPVILFLAITLLPVIWNNGTVVEISATAGFILVWAGLTVFDIKHERMDQRKWLQSHGVTLK